MVPAKPMSSTVQADDEFIPSIPELHDVETVDEEFSGSESEPELSVSLSRPAHSKLRYYGTSESHSKSASQSKHPSIARNKRQICREPIATNVRNREDELTLLDSSEAPPRLQFLILHLGVDELHAVGDQARPQRERSSSGFIPSTIANSTRQNSAANRTNQLVVDILQKVDLGLRLG